MEKKKKKQQQFEELEQNIWDSTILYCNTQIKEIFEYCYEEVIKELGDLMLKQDHLTRTDIYRKLKLEAIYGELGNRLDQLTGERLRDVCKATEQGIGKIEAAVDWHFFTDREVEAIVNRDFHNANFSERIWKNVGMIRARAEKDIARIVINGENHTQITKQLAKDFNVGFKEARRLIRTETSRVFVQSALANFKAAGYEILAIQVKDIGIYPCEACKEQAYDSKGKYKKYTPEEIAEIIPAHPNCRCRPVPFEYVSN